MAFWKLATTMLTALMLSVSVSNSGWRADIGAFKIGIVSDKSTEIAKGFIEPFREALQQELNMPVKVIVAVNYHELIKFQANKKVQYGVHTAASFATNWVKCKCVEPVAAAKLAGGSVKYYSILMVKKNRISDLQEFRVKILLIISDSGFFH